MFGKRQPLDMKKSWTFDDANSLIGLRGTANTQGIASLGVWVYNKKCGADSVTIDPETGKADSIGSQNADGTYSFASNKAQFKNDELPGYKVSLEEELPSKKNVKDDKEIWSFDNPDLAEDAYKWGLETPNIFYVSGVLLLICISIILCCYYRCCCCCCCGSSSKRPNKVQQVSTTPQSELQARRNIKVKDVLQEQGTCEELSDHDYPTNRKLVSQETESNENIPVAVASMASAEQLKKERELDEKREIEL